MTYKEAVKTIESSRSVLDKYTDRTDPAQLVIGTFIGCEKRDFAMEERIFEECVKGFRSNEELLTEMNMNSDHLIPFVVTQKKGKKTVLPLARYISNASMDGSL